MFPQLTHELETLVTGARIFKFSFEEKTYLFRFVFLAKFLFVARICLPPEQAMQKLTRMIFSFLWNASTES